MHTRLLTPTHCTSPAAHHAPCFPAVAETMKGVYPIGRFVQHTSFILNILNASSPSCKLSTIATQYHHNVEGQPASFLFQLVNYVDPIHVLFPVYFLLSAEFSFTSANMNCFCDDDSPFPLIKPLPGFLSNSCKARFKYAVN